MEDKPIFEVQFLELKLTRKKAELSGTQERFKRSKSKIMKDKLLRKKKCPLLTKKLRANQEKLLLSKKKRKRSETKP